MFVVVVEHGDVATLVLQIHFVPQDLKGFVRTHIGIWELWEKQHKSERPVRKTGLFTVLNTSAVTLKTLGYYMYRQLRFYQLYGLRRQMGMGHGQFHRVHAFHDPEKSDFVKCFKIKFKFDLRMC